MCHWCPNLKGMQVQLANLKTSKMKKERKIIKVKVKLLLTFISLKSFSSEPTGTNETEYRKKLIIQNDILIVKTF